MAGRFPRSARFWAVVVLVAAMAWSAACTHLGYYTRSAWGGAKILLQRRPIERELRREDLAEEERRKLQLVLEVLEFAADELELPDNGSYRSFVRLDRSSAVWTVVAAPTLSLDPVVWCFAFAGCVSYRGYFSESRAHRFAARQGERGYNVAVGGASAYSTLGWFKDPVLSTFLLLPDGDLLSLLIHELAHQRLYLKGDTRFNESFASYVEQVGAERFLAEKGMQGELARWELSRERERQALRLLSELRSSLAEVYGSDLEDALKMTRKAELIAEAKRRYRGLSEPWREGPRYDGWFEREINNAHLVSIADYSDWVGAFRVLHRQSGELSAFYAAAEQLAELPAAERQRRLEALAAIAAKPPPPASFWPTVVPSASPTSVSRLDRASAAPDPGSR